VLRLVIVDDESLARRGLRQLLSVHADVSIVGEANRVSTAADMIRAEKPDAVFLDIQMPGADGFALLGELDYEPKIVFVTAHSQHAVRAFEVQAIDYLLKPVHPERLAAAVQRLTAACAQEPEATRYAPGDRICLRTPQRTLIAALPDITALEAEGDFTRFHIVGESPLLIYRTLGACETILPSPPFLRVSRSLIVNLDRLAAIEQQSRDEARITLRDGPRPFMLGRRALTRLKQHTAA
jgi:two-component system, LytTR family, response regulator